MRKSLSFAFMPSAVYLVAGGAFPTPTAVSGVAGDKPRVNSGGFDPGFDLSLSLTCGPRRLLN